MRLSSPCLCLLLLAACAGEASDRRDDDPSSPGDSTPPRADSDDTGSAVTDTGDDTASTTPTGDSADTIDTGPVPTTLSAVCTLTKDNPLRAWCDVTVDPPQPVEVWFQRSDGNGPERVHASDEAVDAHRVGLYMMEPDTSYDIEARTLTGDAMMQGSLVTGLPSGGMAVLATTDGTSSATYFGMQSPCFAPSAVVLNTDGVPVWGHTFFGSGNVEGVSFTEDDTVIGLLNAPDQVVEVDRMGREQLRLVSGVDYPDATHHDAFRRDGRTYVLFNHASEGLTLDGFYVFEGTQLLGTWYLEDHHDPDPGGGLFGFDYSHANAIWVDADGEIYVSFRHLSGVMKVRGIDDPAFGEVIWTLSGDPADMPLGTDFTLTGSATSEVSFQRQHNVHRTDDGQLAMFDNRANYVDASRLLHLDVDETGMQADITEAWTLPNHCAFQGGAWSTDAGNPVATCAQTGTGFEFTPGAPDAVFTIDATCFTSPFDNYIPRMVPLAW